MITQAPPQPEPPLISHQSPLTYLNIRQTVSSWLLTTDHKRIALLYMVSITLFFFIGATFGSIAGPSRCSGGGGK